MGFFECGTYAGSLRHCPDWLLLANRAVPVERCKMSFADYSPNPYMDNYDAYLAALPAGSLARDEDRHVITLRLTKLLLNQNLALSVFSFYSPSDKDGYLRSKANYKICIWHCATAFELLAAPYVKMFC